ncbi:MAG: hypothetical protein JSS97_05815, partial [Actinobacteria bacterium]|nr:hypothetical protein [Actinomycetota bacterium]
MRFELAPGVRRTEGGRLLAGGTPPRLLRLSERGAAALDRILGVADGPGQMERAGGRAAVTEDQLGDAAERLAARLAGEGTLVPVPADPSPAARLTTVVPVRDGGP